MYTKHETRIYAEFLNGHVWLFIYSFTSFALLVILYVSFRMKKRKKMLVASIGLLLVCGAFLNAEYCSEDHPVVKCKPEEKCDYKPTWESLDARPLPEWYDRDKFGIFIHWGVFAVPAQGEWFWYNWKQYEYPAAIKYMKNNFKPNFTYQDFGPSFTAEFYNATEWVELFKKSKARYVVLTSKHHEGYTLWPSKYSFSWNSQDVGPHRDLVGELATAVRKNSNIRFGLYHSLYEWFNPLYLEDKKNNFTTSLFVDFKTGPELYELVKAYEPEVVWSDGEWEATDDYWKAKEFLAWLYNKSPVKDTVVVDDRWGQDTLCKHGGFLTCTDRYNPGKLQTRKWENAMTIDKRTWGYRANSNIDEYFTTSELIKELVITVSCGGNLLLNVGPTLDGKIPLIFQERLLDIGQWLDVNGEGIFSTTPWTVCQNDTLNAPETWYTTNKPHLYATFFHWPANSTITLRCLKDYSFDSVQLIGYAPGELTWLKTASSVLVNLPRKETITSSWAWVLKFVNLSTLKPDDSVSSVMKENDFANYFKYIVT